MPEAPLYGSWQSELPGFRVEERHEVGGRINQESGDAETGVLLKTTLAGSGASLS